MPANNPANNLANNPANFPANNVDDVIVRGVKPMLWVPTKMERERLIQFDARFERAVISGFGLIETAIRATRYLAEHTKMQGGGSKQDNHQESDVRSGAAVAAVAMVGIAGTYHTDDAAVGSAMAFSHVRCDGLGVGQPPEFISHGELPFGDLPEHIRLDGFASSGFAPESNDSPGSPTGLVSVAAASGDFAQATERRERLTDCVAEDMESFAAAAVCAKFGVPFGVIRGFSNPAGDRQWSRWRIDDALSSVAKLADSMQWL